ncbi:MULTISPECIES: sporulation inhibitor of replication protein SirA [Virgibacillus]|uniref:Sporulation inhibitor of replication protein SirA n=2 Tax=Virgibacillus TaxID=84406 RepID=A0A024QCI4_9BACI|nr:MULTISPECIES: sporulation inhibitor of replication protein SirA [Virgibacillus]EQB36215.1 hypothetical protein M948_14365 [Virgibacillus sp. CM-4]MYL42088.1 sporulation inhibitor of replication protein SirA [Virgibacillus massiliensis]GGJ45692.1 hypothetical protein GCM10007111_04610 [Virgibacillus kapii]CDQ39915.1 Sporulation inhibitor of replication protein SirA [Virgibacillus massiliensis]
MYTYSIFWIKEEVATHYFHKSGILYRFFKDYQTDPEREDLSKQFKFITYEFNENVVIDYLKKNETFTMMKQDNHHTLKIYNKETYISLHMSEKQLKFRCKTLQDAEALLFPMLRQFQPLLFIVGDNIQNFGWIAPLLRYSKTGREQVLYSFL